jgi:hypothetical protein
MVPAEGLDFVATGNWKYFTQFDPAGTGNTLDDQRVYNWANEITWITSLRKTTLIAATFSLRTSSKQSLSANMDEGKPYRLR